MHSRERLYRYNQAHAHSETENPEMLTTKQFYTEIQNAARAALASGKPVAYHGGTIATRQVKAKCGPYSTMTEYTFTMPGWPLKIEDTSRVSFAHIVFRVLRRDKLI
jgi:hypothetical protein